MDCHRRRVPEGAQPWQHPVEQPGDAGRGRADHFLRDPTPCPWASTRASPGISLRMLVWYVVPSGQEGW